MERCSSPLNPNCGSGDIALYIVYGGRKLPICRRCWEQIAETDMEWGDGVSRAKLKRQVEALMEAERETGLKRVGEECARKAAEKFMRNMAEASSQMRG